MDALRQGIAANPESCLLHFKLAELLESSIPAGDNQDAIKNRGQQVRKPYDDLLNTLYGLADKLQNREREEIAKLEALDARSTPIPDIENAEGTDVMRQNAIRAIREGMKAQQTALQRTISAVWINLMRAMRRIEGHGKVNGPIGGSRQIFMDARKRGKITSDVFVASALIEYHCYKDPSATKIFERGMKLFPEDEDFALEYLKHLLAINDVTSKLPFLPLLIH
jgi:cleavage stimulation factor subunit 3